MKFILQVIAIALAGFVVQLFLPFWSLALVAFAIGYVFALNGWMSFLAGFLGAGLLWLNMAYYVDYVGQHILTPKVALLFPTKSVALLFITTAVVGGLVGGFACLSGALFTYKKRKW